MFRDDVSTPWGPAIDFRRTEVRRFFTENALYWLIEYRFDGLRFDAVHAIRRAGLARRDGRGSARTVEPERQVHLVLENDDNTASHLAGNFDAQWNDDGHHVLHVLLTGEREGYYADYAEEPAARLARCLKEGFIYQGEPSPYRGGKPRGSPSADLPPTAFVLFLQNHDQVGNRAFGERLTQVVRPGGARSRHCAATFMSANSAHFHGRGRGEHSRRSCSSPTTTRPRQSRARGPAPRICRRSRNLPIPTSVRRSPIQMRSTRSNDPSPLRIRAMPANARHSIDSCCGLRSARDRSAARKALGA